MNWRNANPFVAIVLLACMNFSGCNSQQAGPPPAAPTVKVVTLKPERIELTKELPGRTVPFRIAEIRPQVGGLIQKRFFVEGSDVKAGDILYQIDPAPFQAALDTAKANLLSARKTVDRVRADWTTSIATLKRHEATLALARTNFERFEKLIKNKAISPMEHDQGEADLKVAEAALKTAEAQVNSNKEAVDVAEAAIEQADAAIKTAQINLAYTKITAPISGRIGRSNLTEGAIATAYQQTSLATIQQLDPIYVDLVQATSELLRLKRRLANGNLKEYETDRVKIILEDDTEYKVEGSLKFKDVTVHPSMLSFVLRIEVPNPDELLLPGMYLRAMINEGVQENAILIPQQSLQRDFRGNPYVWIVDAQGVVQQKQIMTGREFGDKVLVNSGLAEGDRVIVEGIQSIRNILALQEKAKEKNESPAMAKVVPVDFGPTKDEKLKSKLPTAPTSK